MLTSIVRAFSPAKHLTVEGILEVKQLGPGLPQTSTIETMTDEEFTKYSEVVEKLGMRSSGTYHTAWIEHWLQNNHAHIYPYESVEKYLDSKFDKPGWIWRPVRSKDLNAVDDHGNFAARRKGHYEHYAGVARTLYNKRVPMPVLHTIAKYPGECLFFISDERMGSDFKDPFLAVAAGYSNFYVIERWDEPSFRG